MYFNLCEFNFWFALISHSEFSVIKLVTEDNIKVSHKLIDTREGLVFNCYTDSWNERFLNLIVGLLMVNKGSFLPGIIQNKEITAYRKSHNR